MIGRLAAQLLTLYFDSFQDDEFLYYPDDKEHLNSFAYVLVDPVRRHVTVFSHRFAGGVFWLAETEAVCDPIGWNE